MRRRRGGRKPGGSPRNTSNPAKDRGRPHALTSAAGGFSRGRAPTPVDSGPRPDYMPRQMLLQQEEHVGVLVAAVRRRIRQVVHAEAGGHRLSPQQFWSLLGIHEAGPLSLGALAERLRIDPPTASRVVASLTRQAARPDGGGSRRTAAASLIETTAEGADLADRVCGRSRAICATRSSPGSAPPSSRRSARRSAGSSPTSTGSRRAGRAARPASPQRGRSVHEARRAHHRRAHPPPRAPAARRARDRHRRGRARRVAARRRRLAVRAARRPPAEATRPRASTAAGSSPRSPRPARSRRSSPSRSGSQVSGRIQQLFVDFNTPGEEGAAHRQDRPAALPGGARAGAGEPRRRAQADLTRAKVQAADAARQLERTRSLAERKLVAQADLDTAQANADAAQAARRGGSGQGRAGARRAPAGAR